MGNCTFVLDSDPFSPVDGSNAGYQVRGVVTWSTTYAAGGDSLAASLCGIGTITKIDIGGASNSNQTAAYLAEVNPTTIPGTTVKLQLFDTGSGNAVAFTENTTANVSGVSASVIIYGT